jgi:hypothetical protein
MYTVEEFKRNCLGGYSADAAGVKIGRCRNKVEVVR